MGACLRPSCQNTSLVSSESPSHKVVATVFERNCGATTDFSRMVSLSSPGSDIFDDRRVVYIVNGQHDVEIEWADADTVRITCSTCADKDIFRKSVKIDNVEIVY